MRGWPLGLVLALGLASCSVDPAPQPPPALADPAADEPGTPPGQPERSDAITMSRINLYLHDTRPTQGRPRKPTFWVQASSVSLIDAGAQSFEDAHAVLYGLDGDAGDVVFDAARGRFQEGESATLDGGVVARIGRMTVALQDIEWVNAERVARTDNPVRIVDGDTCIEAATLRLYPDRKEFCITDATGIISFERKEP